jgi:2-polyprenyl-3-methyl-5-hydroxy-6-metoxy-1,4-benzoquinol methylase
MNNEQTRMVEECLAKPDVHLSWESGYRDPQNERFYEMSFDRLVQVLKPPGDSLILDAGCGPGYHSIRLARRGFRVTAIDFSESILPLAEENVRAAGLAERISFRREDLLHLSFADKQFDYILCWGVAMHIPEAERALSELARVLKPGGALILSEPNMHSFESRMKRFVKRILGKTGKNVQRTPKGVEEWTESSAGSYMTRQTDIRWLEQTLANQGLQVKTRFAGQFSEAYSRLPGKFLKSLVHAFNHFWFNTIRIPGPAFGNLIIFEKPPAPPPAE